MQPFNHELQFLGHSCKVLAYVLIGLYRVPFFAPHEYLAFSWVSDAKDVQDGNFCVNFKASDLPKEEDFYQFQFLRTDEQGSESAIGASIPFQLQAPKSEELCTVEDDEEFMVVRYEL